MYHYLTCTRTCTDEGAILRDNSLVPYLTSKRSRLCSVLLAYTCVGVHMRMSVSGLPNTTLKCAIMDVIFDEAFHDVISGYWPASHYVMHS